MDTQGICPGKWIDKSIRQSLYADWKSSSRQAGVKATGDTTERKQEQS